MKKDIHPQLFDIQARCACGNAVPTRSTQEQVRVDICSACHPFCTGTQKFIDEAGRIEKFKERYNKKKK